MMSSTQCDGIHNAQGATLNMQQLPEYADSVSISLRNICNLPIDIKRMIANNLNSNDYSSLRETCKSMSENLEGFPVMYHSLKHKLVSGDTEKNYREIIYDNKTGSIF